MLSKKILMSLGGISIALLMTFTLWPVSVVKGADVSSDLQFYKGKTVTFIVTTKPGGGYDAYGRLALRFIKKYLPDCTIIIRNIPGAGHIIGMNELYRRKPDGLTFGIGNFKGLISAQVADFKGVGFDLKKVSWLANVAIAPQVLIVSEKLPYRSIDDLKKSAKPIRMTCSGVGSSSYNYTLMVKKILGVNLKPLTGYSGSEGDIAMIRGDADGQIGSYDNLRPLIDNREARLLLVLAKNKMPQFPDVPLISSFATPETQGLIDFINATIVLSRPIGAPPNMPPEKLKLLREIIEKTFEDPGLLAQAKQIKLPIHYVSGEETRKLFVKALEQPPHIVKMIKDLTRRK